jgi:hypothetical protein
MSRKIPGLGVVAPAAGAAAVGAALLLLPQAPAFGESSGAPPAQATSVSPQPTASSVQPIPPERPVRFYNVDPIFQAYYNTHDGPRVMGGAISPRTSSGGVPAQYFEKARLEDSRTRNRTGDPNFDFEYGLLVDEMKAVRSLLPIGGERSTVTYDTLQTESDPAKRVPPPPGFSGNVFVRADGSAFVPFSADLSPAPGHNVPVYFWNYMNNPVYFPAGWLHDIGLPITEPIPATVDKGRIFGTEVQRFSNVPIVIQAFQRTILTYDPANPSGFEVERANEGTNYSRLFPQNVPNP